VPGRVTSRDSRGSSHEFRIVVAVHLRWTSTDQLFVGFLLTGTLQLAREPRKRLLIHSSGIATHVIAARQVLCHPVFQLQTGKHLTGARGPNFVVRGEGGAESPLPCRKLLHFQALGCLNGSEFERREVLPIHLIFSRSDFCYML
jgi:hypothetical protein